MAQISFPLNPHMDVLPDIQKQQVVGAMIIEKVVEESNHPAEEFRSNIMMHLNPDQIICGLSLYSHLGPSGERRILLLEGELPTLNIAGYFEIYPKGDLGFFQYDSGVPVSEETKAIVGFIHAIFEEAINKVKAEAERLNAA